MSLVREKSGKTENIFSSGVQEAKDLFIICKGGHFQACGFICGEDHPFLRLFMTNWGQAYQPSRNVTDMAWENMKSMTKDISDKESLRMD